MDPRLVGRLPESGVRGTFDWEVLPWLCRELRPWLFCESLPRLCCEFRPWLVESAGRDPFPRLDTSGVRGILGREPKAWLYSFTLKYKIKTFSTKNKKCVTIFEKVKLMICDWTLHIKNHPAWFIFWNNHFSLKFTYDRHIYYYIWKSMYSVFFICKKCYSQTEVYNRDRSPVT